MAKVLAIDLGTTFSRMAVMESGGPVILLNREGERSTPSVVAFTTTGERLVGVAAKRQRVTNSNNTVDSITRFMGRRFGEVQEELKHVPYNVVSETNGSASVEVEVDGKPKRFSPSEIAAYILCKLRLDAESILGEPIGQTVITVPASFNDSQRQATKDAGRIAGLEVLRIINGPTAGAVGYGWKKQKDGTIAVYDLGGGTFDFSVLEMGDGIFEVVATNGDTRLGGDDWDNRIAEWVLDEFKKQHGVDLRNQPAALQRLREESENAKIALSGSMAYEINLPYIIADATGPKHFNVELTRARLEGLCDDLFQRTISVAKNCLKDAARHPESIDQLVLVGGMSGMPRVVEIAGSLFNKPPQRIINPDEVVALGTAIHAGMLEGVLKDMLWLDVSPASLGVETSGGVSTKIIERNTTIPCRKVETFSTAVDNQSSVEMHLLQGEGQFARDNRTIGKFHLTGIPPAPRGVPQIGVTFDIDSSGSCKLAPRTWAQAKRK